MKNTVGILVCLFLAFSGKLAAQDYYKQFSPIAEQPDVDSIVTSGGNDDYIYVLTRMRKSGGTDSGTLVYYDGSSWYNSPSFDYKGKSEYILYHDNAYYIHGKFKEVNGIAAPSGRYFSLVRLEGNAWDTAANSLLNDTIKNTHAVCNDDGIYIINESSKKMTQLLLYKAGVGYTKTFKVSTSFASYQFLGVTAKGSILFAYTGLGGNVTLVDGVNLGEFFQIKKGVASTPALTNGGAILGADITYKDEIVYFREINSRMQLYNGSTNKDIDGNLSKKIFGAVPPMATEHGIMMVGILNNINNSMYILDKDSTNWADLHLGNFSFGILYSKSLGIYLYNRKTLQFKYLKPGGRLEGKLYLDDDSTCTYDTSELLLTKQMLRFETDNGPVYTLTDDKGFYSVTAAEGVLTVKPTYKYLDINPCVLLPDTLLSGVSKARNLPAHHSHRQDLEGVFAAATSARWGDTVSLKALVMNHGLNSRFGKVRIKMPAGVQYVSSKPAGTLKGNTVEWDMSALKAMKNTSFSISVGIDTGNIKLGSSICYYLRVDTFSNEKDTFNNFDTLCQHIVASYDPNSKESYPSGDISYTPAKINYVINFQNLGSDYARHIVIRDTLSGLLDISKLQLLESSHNCKYTLENNVLIMSFRDINLDYAGHSVPASKGWTAFSIGVAQGLKPGTVVKNKAYIYFDYNPAIITNETQLKLVKGSTGITPVQQTAGIKVYPNPVNGMLKIENIATINQEVQVYNMQGVLVRSLATNGASSVELDMKDWNSGIYFIRIGIECVKIMKID